ncbi:MAG: L-aspartate oxidase [Bacteroidia bacterium]
MQRKRIICAGNGLASMCAALALDESTEIILLSAGDEFTSNSFMAKGGVAFPVSEADIEAHISDTVKTGSGLCDEESVRDIITSGLGMLKELQADGFLFDHHLAKEGGHSLSRVRHVGDETGKHLVQFYYQQLMKRSNIQVLKQGVILKLWIEDKVCVGALIANPDEGTAEWVRADGVILATGGCGNLFAHHSNSHLSNGEGYAIAYAAGAPIYGMEFMQFHPTMGIPAGEQAIGYLVTEAFRGAGAILCDEAGRELMHGVHPLSSLAPRDIVSKTLYQHLLQSQQGAVWLDYNRIPQHTLQTEFPALYAWCNRQGYQEHKKIPVSPAAHYMCGGIQTNRNGETGVSNVYAIGEVANTGLHGANRLASNSLLELLIMARRAAQHINEKAVSDKMYKTASTRLDHSDLDEPLQHLQTRIQYILWNNFGIVRRHDEMLRGLDHLMMIEEELLSYHKPSLLNIGLKRMHNRLITAKLIAQGAMERLESRGCHFRSDHPLREPWTTETPLHTVNHPLEMLSQHYRTVVPLH